MEPSRSHDDDATSSTCFSGILRRLLCSGAHPTYPSDTIVNESTQPHFNRSDQLSKPEKSVATPGIVARLMGLDSLPETNDSFTTGRRTLESILRSRSVNSVNYVPEFDLLSNAQQHRRAKTSVSFREIPTFLNEPNHDFVVLCFERVWESNGTRFTETKKTDMGLGLETEIIKQRKGITEKTERKEVFHHRRNRDAVNPRSSEEKLVKKRRRRTNKKKKKRADVRKSETGNPTRPETKLPERSRKPVSSSRRSSSRKDELEFDEYPCQNYYSSSRTDLISPDYIEFDEEDTAVKAKEAWDENHVKLIEQIRSLSEEHIDRDYQWAAKRFDEEVEEICNEFGQQLLDHMINQVVDELVTIWPDYNSS